ncbi:MAG: hypothetical protein GY795_07150 [Desulfobacterales bacterium]|nr:hypothetical protein [Desulfobacterales bacterium]
MAVINLIEPINPALTTPFVFYKDTIQGRKPFPSEPYCFGLFDTLVALLDISSYEHEKIVILPRWCADEEPDKYRCWEAGFEEAREIYSQQVNALSPESLPEKKECLA